MKKLKYVVVFTLFIFMFSAVNFATVPSEINDGVITFKIDGIPAEPNGLAIKKVNVVGIMDLGDKVYVEKSFDSNELPMKLTKKTDDSYEFVVKNLDFTKYKKFIITYSYKNGLNCYQFAQEFTKNGQSKSQNISDLTNVYTLDTANFHKNSDVSIIVYLNFLNRGLYIGEFWNFNVGLNEESYKLYLPDGKYMLNIHDKNKEYRESKNYFLDNVTGLGNTSQVITINNVCKLAVDLGDLYDRAYLFTTPKFYTNLAYAVNIHPYLEMNNLVINKDVENIEIDIDRGVLAYEYFIKGPFNTDSKTISLGKNIMLNISKDKFDINENIRIGDILEIKDQYENKLDIRNSNNEKNIFTLKWKNKKTKKIVKQDGFSSVWNKFNVPIKSGDYSLEISADFGVLGKYSTTKDVIVTNDSGIKPKITMNVLDKNANLYTGQVELCIATNNSAIYGKKFTIDQGKLITNISELEGINNAKYLYVIPLNDKFNANSLKINLSGKDFSSGMDIGNVNFQEPTIKILALDSKGILMPNSDIFLKWDDGDLLITHSSKGDFALAPLSINNLKNISVRIENYNEGLFSNFKTIEGNKKNVKMYFTEINYARSFDKYSKLLENNIFKNSFKKSKVFLGIKVLSIINDIDEGIQKDKTTKNVLKKYGFSDDAVLSLIATMVNSKELLLNILDDNDAEGYQKYFKYEDQIKILWDNMYNALPIETRDELDKYEYYGHTKVAVLKKVFDVIMSSGIGSETYNTETGIYSNEKFGVKSDVTAKLVELLSSIRKSSTLLTSEELKDINDLSEALVATINITIEATINNLSDVNKNNALILAKEFGLIKITNHNPVIKITGGSYRKLMVGDDFSSQGVTAIDVEDGEITPKISGNVDTNKEGIYKVVYTATDSDGAKSSKTLTVEVKKISIILSTSTASNKVKVTMNDSFDISKLKISIKEKYGSKLEVPVLKIESDGSNTLLLTTANQNRVLYKITIDCLLNSNNTLVDDDVFIGLGEVSANLQTYLSILGDLGISKNSLSINSMLTREDMIVIFTELMGCDAEAKSYFIPSIFEDISSSIWKRYIAYVYMRGWMNEKGQLTHFKPNSQVTANDIAMYMLKSLGYNPTKATAFKEAKKLGIFYYNDSLKESDNISKRDAEIIASKTLDTNIYGKKTKLSDKLGFISNYKNSNEAPVVTINGEHTITLTVGDKYTEFGASAKDKEDGEIIPVKTGNVDMSKEGIYAIKYTATDALGYKRTAVRIVTVKKARVDNGGSSPVNNSPSGSSTPSSSPSRPSSFSVPPNFAMSNQPTNENTSALNKNDEKAVADISKNLPLKGKKIDNAMQEKIKQKVEALVKNMNKDSLTAKDADKKVIELNKTIKKVIESLNSDKALEVVNNQIDLTNKVLNNTNLDFDSAKTMVKDMISTNVKTLLAKEDINREERDKNTKSVKTDIALMVKKVIKKAATLEIKSEKAINDKSKVTNFKVTKEQMKNIITSSLSAKLDMVKSLNENGLEDVAKEVKQNVNIKLPKVKDDQKTSLKLDEESINKLSEGNVGLTVEAKGVNFILPVSLMKTVKTGLTIESNEVLNTVVGKTNAGKAKPLKTMDLSVGNGGNKVKGQVELSFDISEVAKTDLDSLMIGVLENGRWKKLNYRVEENKIIFTAPHFSIYSLMQYESTFEDIDKNWAKKYIDSLTTKGIVDGKSDIAFDPQGQITRAEFAKLLVTYLKLDDAVNSNFKDVAKDSWYYNVVGIAGINGISAGAKEGDFYPNQAITREDMAVMIAKAYSINNGVDLEGTSDKFGDDALISDYAKKAVYASKSNGIITGYADNTFKPKSTATRAEAVKIIYEFLNK
ncbi:S-layer homology domain-containing protein [Helicovermis profundi]|uniref:SLH domain-containing protein n=1 Tax=Helicovermis profundi TaxID=3065157 RepID=A0AAU9EHQ7_9FIRM|nr:hypothetical protein HLPR_27080 [Clostridia bacterium S502]